jgi:hypothetical protein
LLRTFESFINISEEHLEPEPLQLSMTWAQLRQIAGVSEMRSWSTR